MKRCLDKRRQTDDQRGERALINAILVQAFNDAIGLSTSKDRSTAIRFINSRNRLFRFYCGIIGWDPIYVERKFHERIRQFRLRPLKRFRK